MWNSEVVFRATCIESCGDEYMKHEVLLDLKPQLVDIL